MGTTRRGSHEAQQNHHTSVPPPATAVAVGLARAPWAVSQAATTSAGASPGPATAGSLPVIHVSMNGKKITVSGALQSGGVRIVSSVTGENGGEPTFIRLDPGVTFAQFEKALPAIGADPNNLDGIGAIVMSAMAPKGTSSAADQPGAAASTWRATSPHRACRR